MCTQCLIQIKPNSEAEVMGCLGLVNMFVSDLAESFLNVQSSTLHELLESFTVVEYQDSSSEAQYLKDDQKKFIHSQLHAFVKKFEETQAMIAVEKSRQEDELHQIFKRGAEMPADKKESYEGTCFKYEQIRWTGAL